MRVVITLSRLETERWLASGVEGEAFRLSVQERLSAAACGPEDVGSIVSAWAPEPLLDTNNHNKRT